ncbi:uncharacterized protein [Fopius arisanus]|uniref:Uncharacterized protein n=1 Tax=Fopius arisanus TaxID=64838 RepID=A0A9R1TFD1_9HYME|nr:PREDICTED: uncharacterized protein LOC105269788 [Fopius arisanus]
MMMARLFILLSVWSVSLGFEGGLLLRDLGERKYNSLIEKSHLPTHGTCWHNALKVLKNNCDKLSDHEHSLLALRLANCFLEDSGHGTYDCYLSESQDVRRKCINSMSDRAFGVYNEFYTHTTHICFFLNHELWQIETNNIIQVLYDASSKMREQLHEASEIQGSMLESQKEGLTLQNKLLDHGKTLEGIIESSAETVNTMVTDFRETSRDQQALLYEIFSYMRTFQDWIIGEVSWFQSILYFTVTCIICALFSSSKRTADARVTLFTILSINVVLERIVVQYEYNTKGITPDDAIQVVFLTWCLRKGALLLCFGVLLHSYYTYRDESHEQFTVLKRIEKQLHTLQDNPVTFRYTTRLAVKKLRESQENRIADKK